MLEYILIAFASLINVLLGLVVLDRKSEISWYQRFFAFSAFSVGMWGFSTILLNYYTVMFWERILFVSAISALYFIVIYSYEYVQKRNDSFLAAISSVYFVIVFLIIFTDTIVSGVRKDPSGGIEVDLGGLMVIFSLYMLFLISLLVYNLYNGFRRSNQLKKLQLKYTLIGILFFVLPALVTNLFLPIMDIYKFNNFGVIFSIGFTGFVSFAIIRHRLFSVRTIMLKILKTLTMAAFLVFIVLVQRYIKDRMLGLGLYQIESVILDFTTAVLVVMGLESLSGWIENQIANILQSEVIKLDRVIEDIDTKTGSKLDAKTVMKETIKIFEEGFPDTKFHYYLKNSQEGVSLYPVTSNDQKEYKFIERSKKIYIFQEDSSRSEFWSKAKKLNVGLILPLSENYSLIGTSSAKQMVYTKSELDTFEEMSTKLRDIFARVELYEQAREFNKVLSKRVDEATKDLQENIEELEEARRKERDMMDIMGHELRTPLSIIKIKQSLLRKKVSEDPESFSVEEFKEIDRSINEALDREIELLETMLSSTKIDAGQIEIVLEKVVLKDIIEASLVGYKSNAEEKGIKLKVDEYNPEITIYADKIGIAEVLDNFVSNAIKYTEEGSVTICVKEKGDQIEVSVVDTGIGIPKKAMKRLGEKFFRVNQYITDGNSENNIVRPGGTGLGLYVTFGLIEMMGGKVKVDSQYRKGSTFSFTIPRYNGQKIIIGDKKARNVFERMKMDKNKKRWK